MAVTRKITLLVISGLILAVSLLILSTSVQAEDFCYFKGPDVSEDLLRLTDFQITGPAPLTVGDTITVSFTLQNWGQSDLELGIRGIFAAARDSDNLDMSFGYSYADTTLEYGGSRSIEVSQVLDKAGTWIIWPSYHLSMATGEKFGPDNWQACTLEVEGGVADYDNDGVADEEDNCPTDYNPNQENVDGDTYGDICDACDNRDLDGDGINGCYDDCPAEPETFNDYQDDDGCPDEEPPPEPEEEDTTAPTVEITTSTDSPGLEEQVIFTSSAQDPSGLKSISILIDGETKKTCQDSCKTWNKLFGRCYTMTAKSKEGQTEYFCSYTGGPYPTGTVTYQAQAVDQVDNQGESAIKELNITAELEVVTPPLTVEGCFHSVSGKLYRFPYNVKTLKIKTCKDPVALSPEMGSLVVCPEEVSYYEVTPGSGYHTYEVSGLCDDTYLIEPVYREAEGFGVCQWRGGWDPGRYILTFEDSNFSSKNFSFIPIEDIPPSVTTNYRSSISRTGGIVSTGDNITYNIEASDTHGIANIQILLKLDDGEEIIIHECPSSTFPRESSCMFIGGPYPGVKKLELKGLACDRNGNSRATSRMFYLTEAHCLNRVKDADEQDVDCGGADCSACRPTCLDGIQNRDEEDVDCGGEYCPPCSQCATGTKWSSHDTPCQHYWPTDEGPSITGNTTSDSCELYELCHPDLDYIVEDAITCCEYSDFRDRFTGHRETNKEAACDYARGTSGINIDYNPVSFKKCLGIYPISALGSAAAYMQGYFYGETCCYGDDVCPDSCSKWGVNPHAWQMGTATSCAGPGGARPDYQMGGHVCTYNYFGVCSISCYRWGESGWWSSDTDWEANSDSMADVPAHASINRLSTGTCVDYSVALTTLLRKVGYSKDEVFSVDGDRHWYNLVKFPGESKWNYVDTVGNASGEIYGGMGSSIIYDSAGNLWSYDYCKKMDDGCSNDYYGESVSLCPPNNQIYTCEGISR